MGKQVPLSNQLCILKNGKKTGSLLQDSSEHYLTCYISLFCDFLKEQYDMWPNLLGPETGCFGKW